MDDHTLSVDNRELTVITMIMVSECLIVSTLNILRLQLHAMTKHQVEPASVGVAGGSRLHSSLKRLVVELASSAFVLETIQAAAQATLQAGWSILLPTADERARTLSSLLSGSGTLCAVQATLQASLSILLLSANLESGQLGCCIPYYSNPYLL